MAIRAGTPAHCGHDNGDDWWQQEVRARRPHRGNAIGGRATLDKPIADHRPRDHALKARTRDASQETKGKIELPWLLDESGPGHADEHHDQRADENDAWAVPIGHSAEQSGQRPPR